MHKEYQTYIDELAKELGTVVVQKPNLAGMMFVEYEPPKIEGPLLAAKNNAIYPDLDCRFMVMLHELGHVFHGHTQGRPPYTDQTFYFDNGVLRSESQAWEYALDHYDKLAESNTKIKSLTKAARKFMWERCLGSYYSGYKASKGQPHRLGNGNRHYVEFHYDEPDDFFWGIKERILNG